MKAAGDHCEPEREQKVVEEVVDIFKQVYMSAEQLREIADQLAGSVQYFHVE